MGLDRLADLKRKLKARTSGGEPIKGFAENVEAIRAEIARLEGITKA